MKAIILAGGFGKRLQPLIRGIPKPMAPVGDRPFLEYLVLSLRDQGITEFILCLYYMADAIMKHFKDGSDFGVKTCYSIEEKPLGTAGAIKQASRYLNETFYALNGDTFSKIDLQDFLCFHELKSAIATVALAKAKDTRRYGLVETSPDGRIQKFAEKEITEDGKAYVSAGIYILEPKALAYIPESVKSSLEEETFPEMVRAGEPIFGYPKVKNFIDIGVPEEYLRFKQEIEGCKERGARSAF